MNDSVGEAISLGNKIIANDVAVDDFLRLMHLYRKGLMNRNQIYSKFCLLFRDHPDILEELQRLAFMDEEQLRQKMAEQQQNLRKEQRVCAALAAADRFTKRVTDERKRGCHHDHDQGTDNDFQIGARHCEGIKVFNKVREKLRNFDEYFRFLKLVYMYSKGKINGGDLETMVAELLQNDTDLIKEFAGFKRLCESDSDLGSVAWGARNKAQELQEERELKQRRKTEKGRAEGGEKKLKVTIINGFNQKRCTPSYRPRLLDEFPASNAASTSKEAAILNDYWVCEPCPDTYFSSKPVKEIASKGPEDVYEDERYMLDMNLESLKSAIDNAQKLQSHIQGISNELLDLETPIRLENYFTASNLKLLSGELNGLRRKPAVALPDVLARLNQKKEEVLKAISGMRVGFVSMRRRNKNMYMSF